MKYTKYSTCCFEESGRVRAPSPYLLCWDSTLFRLQGVRQKDFSYEQ